MRHNIPKYGWAVFLLLFSFSCGRTPDGVLSEKKMKEVTVDMKLAESMIDADNATYPDNEKREALYRSVFKKHRITEAEYDSSLVWYGKNIEIYMEVYDLALKELDRQIADLGDIKPEMATPVSVGDSVNIWPLQDYYTFEPRKLNLLAFDLKEEAVSGAGNEFVLSLNTWGISAGNARVPELRLTVEQSDTTLTTHQIIRKDGYYEVEVNALPTKQIKRVYGYIRLFTNESDYAKIYLDRIMLTKYRQGYRTTSRQLLEPMNIDP